MPEARVLRKGYTTGTCAAAGAKAAAHALLGGGVLSSVEVTLPSGSSLTIPVKSVVVSNNSARAVIIKDAGDDPDVTNGAEFVAEVRVSGQNAVKPSARIRGGEGVGVVTRPGLKVAPGRPAINPVPLKMIRAALFEAAKAHNSRAAFVVTISVPRGRELAKRTMNARLGIVGGISILGTSGIVEPMSLAAYTHSISLGVDVALASGLNEVVFSTGRSSEKVAERELQLPEVAFVLTGDHMGHALRDAAKKPGLKSVTVAGQFGKFTKLAANHFETHCSDSSVEFAFLADLCARFSAGEIIIKKVLSANTAREVYLLLKEKGPQKVITEVCRLVRKNSEKIAGKKVRAVLVGYENDLASIAR
jgi:cobalt-precorrin-5B (C1)-methyltransferase